MVQDEGKVSRTSELCFFMEYMNSGASKIKFWLLALEASDFIERW